jgi:hypothetical protein
VGEAAAGAVDVAASGVGDVAVAGVGVGEAFVSSAREAVPLADTRTITVPARTNERIFVTQFNIVWVGFDRWFLVKACWHRPFLFLEKPQKNHRKGLLRGLQTSVSSARATWQYKR